MIATQVARVGDADVDAGPRGRNTSGHAFDAVMMGSKLQSTVCGCHGARAGGLVVVKAAAASTRRLLQLMADC